MREYKQRLQSPQWLCSAGDNRKLLGRNSAIKHKDENEVLLTFLYLTSSPSSELIRYKALVPPEGYLRISIARSISSSWGTPDISTKKRLKQSSRRCLLAS